MNSQVILERCRELSEELVHSAEASAETEQGLRRSNGLFMPIPSLPVFERLQHECFEASLRTEEGRPVLFEVRFVSTEAFAVHFAHESVRLDPLLPFDARLLAKLSPALATPGVWLAVEENPAAPTGVSAHSLVLLDQDAFSPFTVRSLSAGHLEFLYRSGPIAERRGLSLQLLSTPSSVPFLALMEAWPGAELNPHTGVQALQGMARVLRGKHLGGTVVILPTDEPAEIRPGYRVDQQRLEAWPSILKEWDRALRNAIKGEKANLLPKFRAGEYREAIQFVASLAAVDGAAIMGPDLRLRSFGSILSAPSWSGPVEIVHERQEPRRLPLKDAFHGTRHTSAVNFAGAVPGSVVMVVSHDGDLTFFYAAGDVVRAYQPSTQRRSGTQ